jgi:8-oxo-dGTP pyrophosphatase MutT (NUDIX family)
MTISVATAILYLDDKFLIQLRDDIPNIFYPAHWGLFGGHIEENETPEEALRRELIEEIGYSVEDLAYFSKGEDQGRIRYTFSAPLIIPLDEIILNEGWDYSLVSFKEIKDGQHYSWKAGGKFPFVPHIRDVLLDFIDKN